MTEQGPEGDADARMLMSDAVDMPYGEPRSLLTERALRVAERDGDHELVFDILGELIPTYRYGGEAAKSLSSFVRLVSEFDAGHGEPKDWAAHTVRWYYKWAISLLLDYPQFSLERINSVLDEMERRYQEDGQSMHAVYRLRNRLAAHLDDAEGADHWYAKWIAAPADDNADCEGCNPTSRAAYLAWRGRDEDAIELATPVLQGHLSCREQPHGMLTALLLPYLRTGRLEQAVDAHRRAYRTHRGELSDLGQIGFHIRFCALTGNEPRGLEIVERHLSWLDRFTTPDDASDFASDVALLLHRLPRETAVYTSGVRIGSEPREMGDRTEAGELADRLLEWAYEIGARFDTRNGNTSYTDGIAKNQAREPVVDYLPVTPYKRRAGSTRRLPGSAGTGAGSNGVPDNEKTASGGPDDPSGLWVSDPQRIAESDPAALLDLAEEHWWNNRPDTASVHWTRFDQVAPTDEAGNLTVDSPLRARRTEGLGLQAVERRELTTAAEFFEAAQEIFASAGAYTRMHQASARIAQAMAENGELEHAIERLRVVLGELGMDAEVRTLRSVELRLARALLLADRYDELEQVIQQSLQTDDPALRGNARLLRAQALASQGTYSDALVWLERALSDAREIRSERLYPLLGTRVALLIELAEPQAEDSTIRTALDDYVEAASAPGERAKAHAKRGRWLLRHGEPEAAVPDLAETVAELTAMSTWATEYWVDLGEAYVRSNRPMDAAEVLEEVVSSIRRQQPPLAEQGAAVEQNALDRADDPEMTFDMRRARYLLSRAKMAMHEGENAVADLEAVADAERTLGDLRQAALISEELAILLSELDRDEDAGTRFGSGAELFAAVGELHGEVRCLRRQALCIFYGPDEEKALPVFDRARSLLSERGSELDEKIVVAEHAMLDLGEAKTLNYLHRSDAAHDRARSAVVGFEKLGAEENAREARAYLQERDDTA